MSQRFRFKLSHELFEAFPDAAEQMDARPDNRPFADFVSETAKGATPEDAITLCAYALPGREAIWWACQCLKKAPESLDPADQPLIEAAEQWVRRPEEESRVAALKAGLGAPTKTPGAWLALAAGWSSGSILEPGEHDVEPPPSLTARAVNAGILGCLARVDRKARAGKLRLFVEMGLELASH